MADTDTISLEFIARRQDIMIDALRTQAREHADFRTLVLGLIEQGHRFERRLNDVVPEVELMLKSDTMGRFANFEARTDEKLAAHVGPLHQATRSRLSPAPLR
jgi:hypothetical protein